MKKTLLILICLLLLPIGVFAKECDTSKITIKSVEVNNKYGSVEEKTQPTFKDKTIGVDLFFVDVDDYIEYTLVIKNDSDEDYEFDKNSVALNLDYMKYSLKSEDTSNIIKAGEEKKILLRVTYDNLVDNDKFTNGVYKEEKNLALNLSNREVVSNPKTSTYVIIVLLVVGLLLIGSIIVLKGSTRTKLLSLLLVLSLIPITTLAICKCELKVDSKIEINEPNVCIIRQDPDSSWCENPLEARYDINTTDIETARTILGNTPAVGFINREDYLCWAPHIQRSPVLSQTETCKHSFIDSVREIEENEELLTTGKGCYIYAMPPECDDDGGLQ